MKRRRRVRIISILVVLAVTIIVGLIYNKDIIVYKDTNIVITSDRKGLIDVVYKGKKEYGVLIVYKDTYKNQYILNNDSKTTIGLTYGSGNYKFKVGEYDNSKTVNIDKEFNYYLKDYNQQNVFTKGEYYIDKRLKQYMTHLMDNIIDSSYEYANNIVYNSKLENEVRQDKYDFYIPDLEQVIASNTGICLDKASLLASMLRIQGIPCKIVIGYNNYSEYHAWVQVYKDNKWVSYDPTTGNDDNFIGSKYKIVSYY